VLCFADALCNKKNGERRDEESKSEDHEQGNVEAGRV
jgi:hypothetical protein